MIKDLREFKRFLQVYYSLIENNLENNLDEVVESFYENLSGSQIKRSIDITLADFTEEMIEWPPDRMNRANDFLLKNNLPSISSLLENYSKRIKRILRANEIKTDSDYFVVKNLVDNKSQAMSDEKIKLLMTMMNSYEGSIFKENLKER